MNEFTIETAPPTPCRRGRYAHKGELRRTIEGLQLGQVLRWRPEQAPCRSRANEAAWFVSKDFPGRKFTVRKENGGFDIYRIA